MSVVLSALVEPIGERHVVLVEAGRNARVEADRLPQERRERRRARMADEPRVVELLLEEGAGEGQGQGAAWRLDRALARRVPDARVEEEDRAARAGRACRLGDERGVIRLVAQMLRSREKVGRPVVE